MAKDKAPRRLKQQSYGGLEGAVTDIGLDSYATAWRYLGTYIDCSAGSSSSSWSKWWGESSSSSSSSSSSGCTRKLLWAAYKNPNYSGNQIGEYSFYVDGAWDNSTCVSDSCTKMDCHDPWSTSWELIGVYKESVDFGNDMFFEQLFKHQGYCLWDGDKESFDDDGGNGGGSQDHHNSKDYSHWGESDYQFMQAMRNELPSGCTQFKLTYGSEKYYYIDIKPLSQGDMTIGVYTDSSCMKESGYSFTDYQAAYASYYLTATGSSGAFDTWNGLMDSYKTCQPCRAYNREYTYQKNWDHRHLTEYYDGQGDYEINNYNCYDDAHYQNCNQCYKFETHSDMAKASTTDLKSAHNQGTILMINYKGVWYGNGTVGDAVKLNTTSKTYKVAYNSGYYQGWADAMEEKWAAYGGSSDSSVSYSAAGAASLLVCGFALTKAYKRITRRSVEIEEGSRRQHPLL